MSLEITVAASTFPLSQKLAQIGYNMAMLTGTLQRITEQAVELGFDGLEFYAGSEDLPKHEDLTTALRDSGAMISIFNTGRLYFGGCALLHKDLSIRSSSHAMFERFMALAGAAGAAVGVGMVRGDIHTIGDASSTSQELVDIFARLAERAGELGTTLLLEPADESLGAVIPDARSAIEVMKAVNSPHFRLMLDTYQMNQVERSIGDTLKNSLEFTNHIQLYDPDHRPPCLDSTSDPLNWAAIMEVIRTANFQGTFSMPLLSGDESCDFAAESLPKLRSFLNGSD